MLKIGDTVMEEILALNLKKSQRSKKSEWKNLKNPNLKKILINDNSCTIFLGNLFHQVVFEKGLIGAKEEQNFHALGRELRHAPIWQVSVSNTSCD